MSKKSKKQKNKKFSSAPKLAGSKKQNKKAKIKRENARIKNNKKSKKGNIKGGNSGKDKEISKRTKILRKKKKMLFEMGIDLKFLNKQNVNRVKMSDIKNKNVNRQNYPFLFDDLIEICFPDEKIMLMMFRDLNSELDIQYSIDALKNYAVNELIDKLSEILEHEYDENNSSGSAGVFRFALGTESELIVLEKNMREADSEKQEIAIQRGWTHRRWYGTYQTISAGHDRFIQHTSVHQLLSIIYSVMENVNERERMKYRIMRRQLVRTIPELDEYLPQNKWGI